MVKRIISILVSVTIFVGIGSLVYANIQKGIAKKESEKQRQIKLSKIDRRLMVGVHQVKRGTIHNAIKATGTVQAETQATVFSLVPGIIQSLKVKEGDTVVKGQLLARLDASKMALGYRQAQAGLAQAKLNLENMKINHDRMQKLYEQKAIPQSDFEKIEIGYKVAKQQVKQARAATSLASSTWSDATIKAPIEGTVIVKAVQQGDLMSSAQAMKSSPLVVIAKLGTMKVDFFIREQHISHVRKGLTATVTVDAYRGHKFSGVVDSIGQTLDPATKSLKVTLLIPNKPITVLSDGKPVVIEHPLKIGMFARFSLNLSTERNRIIVPSDAIISKNGVNFAFVFKNGVARRRVLKLGLEENDTVEVRSGLTEHEQLIIIGQRALFDGQPVRLMTRDPFTHLAKKSGGSK